MALVGLTIKLNDLRFPHLPISVQYYPSAFHIYPSLPCPPPPTRCPPLSTSPRHDPAQQPDPVRVVAAHATHTRAAGSQRPPAALSWRRAGLPPPDAEGGPAPPAERLRRVGSSLGDQLDHLEAPGSPRRSGSGRTGRWFLSGPRAPSCGLGPAARCRVHTFGSQYRASHSRKQGASPRHATAPRSERRKTAGDVVRPGGEEDREP